MYSDTEQRTGVFSGTFDPVHIGHIEACLVAKSVLHLMTVQLLIEKQPRHKTGVTDFKHRYEMLDLSLQKYQSLQIADTGENNITTKGCLAMLENNYHGFEYWYIVGSDMIDQMADWQDTDLLFSNFNLCIVLRHNRDKARTNRRAGNLQKQYPNLRYEILPAVWSAVSSSSVKADIKRKGTSANMPPSALSYAKTKKLYHV